MKPPHRIAAALLTSAALLTAGASLSPALAAAAPSTVFVQTDGLPGNQVVAYERHGGGALEQIGTYATGGLGGQLTGSVVDHLASQGGLAYDQHDGLLLAVNAGSNTLAVFGVYGQRLALRQDIPTGGTFPASVTVGNGRAYVLNSAGGGDIQGYSIQSGRLVPIPGANVALGLPQEEPQFTPHPRPGRANARWLEAARDDEGGLERDRGVRRGRRRHAVGSGHQQRARRGAVRGRVRRPGPPRGGRGGGLARGLPARSG